ncbi:MAG: hypothetical protein LH618_03660, partial [Saprospiraceae bacterium]|nr:hypothetical protein [Saprospiraceae bacterium]
MNTEYEKLRSLGYKTLKELYENLEAGTITSIAYEELSKAKTLERASFPKDIRYPKEGDLYT